VFGFEDGFEEVRGKKMKVECGDHGAMVGVSYVGLRKRLDIVKVRFGSGKVVYVMGKMEFGG